ITHAVPTTITSDIVIVYANDPTCQRCRFEVLTCRKNTTCTIICTAARAARVTIALCPSSAPDITLQNEPAVSTTAKTNPIRYPRTTTCGMSLCCTLWLLCASII